MASPAASSCCIRTLSSVRGTLRCVDSCSSPRSPCRGRLSPCPPRHCLLCHFWTCPVLQILECSKLGPQSPSVFLYSATQNICILRKQSLGALKTVCWRMTPKFTSPARAASLNSRSAEATSSQAPEPNVHGSGISPDCSSPSSFLR